MASSWTSSTHNQSVVPLRLVFMHAVVCLSYTTCCHFLWGMFLVLDGPNQLLFFSQHVTSISEQSFCSFQVCLTIRQTSIFKPFKRCTAEINLTLTVKKMMESSAYNTHPKWNTIYFTVCFVIQCGSVIKTACKPVCFNTTGLRFVWFVSCTFSFLDFVFPPIFLTFWFIWTSKQTKNTCLLCFIVWIWSFFIPFYVSCFTG